MKYKRALVFGTFDPLHYAHIRLFKRASKIAEKVYACTESNEVIFIGKKRKAFCSEKQRVEDLRGIKYLSDVGLRSGVKDRGYWAKKFKADVLILGDDWKDKYWAGEELGLPIVYFPRTEGISSTFLREI